MRLVKKDGGITKTTTLFFLFVVSSFLSNYSSSKSMRSLYDVIDAQNISSTVENYAVFNVLHEFSIADERNGKKRYTWDMESANLSQFSDYNYEIASTVQRVSLGKPKLALVVYESCRNIHVRRIRDYLQPIKAAISCHVINENQYDPIDFMEAIHIRGITTAALMLPWYLVNILLTRIVNGHIDDVMFLTIETNSLFLRTFRLTHPRVKITNIMSLDETSVLMEHQVNSLLHSSYCVIMQNAFESDRPSLIRFGNKMACTESVENVIKIVTIEHERYVFVIPERVTFNGNCVTGISCKVPSRGVNSTNWEWLCCAGLYIDIFKLLLQEFNFAFELYVVEDGKFGLFRNGTWNGMIHDIHAKKAHVALQQVTVLAQRFNVVDYTHRVYTSRIPLGIVIRNTNSEYVVINWSFIDSLNHKLLIAVSGTTILILIVIFILENIGDKCSLNIGDKCSLGGRPRRYSFGDSLSYVNGILYQRDIGGIHPRRWPGKVVAIIFAFGMTVMIGTYTAQLTASNISIDEIDKFTGFQDKSFQNPSFRVGVQGSSSYEYFLEKEGIQVTKIVINNWRQGIESVYNRSIDAFVGQSNSLDSMISNENKYCEELLLYRENKYAEDMAFAYQKGLKIGKKISAAVLRLTEKDKIREIVEKWEDAQLCKTKKRKYHRFPWQYGGGLCVILCIAIGACVILLILEHFYTVFEKYRNQVYDVTQRQKNRASCNLG